MVVNEANSRGMSVSYRSTTAATISVENPYGNVSIAPSKNRYNSIANTRRGENDV